MFRENKTFRIVASWFATRKIQAAFTNLPKAMSTDRLSPRASALFMELQGQVQDALRARHERDAREQTLSAEIAAQHPIRFQDEVDYVYKFARNAAGLPRVYYNV